MFCPFPFSFIWRGEANALCLANKMLAFNLLQFYLVCNLGTVMAQLASARIPEREVSGSIFSDLNVCLDVPLIHVAIALNTRRTEHRGRGVKGAPSASIDTSLVTEGTTGVK